ncbi:MAG: YihA family ribosome biogenesis GTP-binding protein [Calditrichaeota bacterium]|nr:MAG: YihA family ribosome biogenesis GTP-binding protein [Calditrichota bacterium]
MKITSVEFIKSVVDLSQIPREPLPEIAFAGRSNVGKSSLINCLLNRRKLAKISGTPGKTRHLNYFKINRNFYFVDLPGYGYARVSRQEQRRWRELIEAYLQASTRVAAVVSIIDSRIGPTPLDLQLHEWLDDLRLAKIVVATKADKLSRGALGRQLAALTKQMKTLDGAIIPFSSVTGTGKKELWSEIAKMLEK